MKAKTRLRLLDLASRSAICFSFAHLVGCFACGMLIASGDIGRAILAMLYCAAMTVALMVAHVYLQQMLEDFIKAEREKNIYKAAKHECIFNTLVREEMK